MGWRYLWREKPLVLSLADSMLIDHDDLKELDCVNEPIDWSRLKWVLQASILALVVKRHGHLY
jgi:hypothetical protein